MGRVNCVAASAGLPLRLFIGTPDGGVWRSDDGGTTGLPRSDFLPVIGVSSLVLDPVNTNTIYMATGDSESADCYSIGVWKSVDGGTNWAATGLSWALNTYNLIYKLAMNPANPQQIFAATTAGLYATFNGGTTWQQMTPGGKTYCYDVAFQPGSSTYLCATFQGRKLFPLNQSWHQLDADNRRPAGEWCGSFRSGGLRQQSAGALYSLWRFKHRRVSRHLSLHRRRTDFYRTNREQLVESDV